MSSAVIEQVDEVYEGRSKTTQRLAAETQLSSIDEIIRDIADGKMVVLVDDEDRENEGSTCTRRATSPRTWLGGPA